MSALWPPAAAAGGFTASPGPERSTLLSLQSSCSFIDPEQTTVQCSHCSLYINGVSCMWMQVVLDQPGPEGPGPASCPGPALHVGPCRAGPVQHQEDTETQMMLNMFYQSEEQNKQQRHSRALLAYDSRHSDWSRDACSSAHRASRRVERRSRAAMAAESWDSARRWSWKETGSCETGSRKQRVMVSRDDSLTLRKSAR